MTTALASVMCCNGRLPFSMDCTRLQLWDGTTKISSLCLHACACLCARVYIYVRVRSFVRACVLAFLCARAYADVGMGSDVKSKKHQAVGGKKNKRFHSLFQGIPKEELLIGGESIPTTNPPLPYIYVCVCVCVCVY